MIDNIVLKPIGVVKSTFKKQQDTKIGGLDKTAEIVIFDEYLEGLEGLDGFSHIMAVFYFHLSEKIELTAIPPRHNPQNKMIGVFATRSPYRPNLIGVSTVELLSIENNVLFIKNKDMLDGSPILDIKPYIPEKIDKVKLGWFIT